MYGPCSESKNSASLSISRAYKISRGAIIFNNACATRFRRWCVSAAMARSQKCSTGWFWGQRGISKSIQTTLTSGCLIPLYPLALYRAVVPTRWPTACTVPPTCKPPRYISSLVTRSVWTSHRYIQIATCSGYMPACSVTAIWVTWYATARNSAGWVRADTIGLVSYKTFEFSLALDLSMMIFPRSHVHNYTRRASYAININSNPANFRLQKDTRE